MLNMSKLNFIEELKSYQTFNLGYYYFYSVGLFAYNKLIYLFKYENNVMIN